MPTLYKSVIQRYQPTPEITQMFPTFRAMMNDCIRIGLQGGDFSYEGLKSAAYPTLKAYDLDHSYRLGAIFEASNLLKKYRTDSKKIKASPPFCKNPFIAAALGVWFGNGMLTLPGGKVIRLNPHTTSVLAEKGLKVISTNLTPTTCSVIYCKDIRSITPRGAIAVDLNEDNITTFDTDGRSLFSDLRELSIIHEAIRRTKSRFRRQDIKIKGRLFRKYAAIEHDRKNAILHRASSSLVDYAVSRRMAIILEDLHGIREEFRRRTGFSAAYLSRMNAWPFSELQRQITYKAMWNGLIVRFVDPAWTSEKCSECGGPMEKPPVGENLLVCLSCGLAIDRDLNGAKNILRRALKSGAVGFAVEAMKGEAPERRLDARADANHSPGPGVLTWRKD